MKQFCENDERDAEDYFKYTIETHRHLVQYPTTEEASNHASEAEISASDLVDAIKKIKKQREMKKNEKLSTSHYM